MNILLYLTPPAAGAVIGYVTNALAIKMLFRPLRRLRLFGRIPVPFTPGILPRQRHKLADNIGRMVERELLTVDILRHRLRSESLRTALGLSVARYTETLFEKRLYEFPPALTGHLARILMGVLSGPAAEELLRFAVQEFSRRASENSLVELLGVSADELQDILTSLLASGMRASAVSAADGIASVADAAYPQFTASLRSFLEREEVRSQLEVQGRIFLRSAILKLNVFQRFFLSAAQYDRTLHDRMPEIIDDLYTQIGSTLEEEDTRRRLTSFIGASVGRILASEESARRLALAAAAWTRPLLDESAGQLLERLGFGGPEEIHRRLAALWTRVKGALTEERIAAAAASFIESRSEATLGELLGSGGERKAKIDQFIADRLLEAAEDRLPAALEALDIRTLVTERIDSLAMEDVERIVLDVLANQLRWINLFGALLGALIGGIQVALSIYLGVF